MLGEVARMSRSRSMDTRRYARSSPTLSLSEGSTYQVLSAIRLLYDKVRGPLPWLRWYRRACGRTQLGSTGQHGQLPGQHIAPLAISAVVLVLRHPYWGKVYPSDKGGGTKKGARLFKKNHHRVINSRTPISNTPSVSPNLTMERAPHCIDTVVKFIYQSDAYSAVYTVRHRSRAALANFKEWTAHLGPEKLNVVSRMIQYASDIECEDDGFVDPRKSVALAAFRRKLTSTAITFADRIVHPSFYPMLGRWRFEGSYDSLVARQVVRPSTAILTIDVSP